MEALGTVETVGLVAAIEAADVACKTANVRLVGYELAKGGGYVTIKLLGKVGAVNAAVSAATHAGNRLSRVVSSLVIPRPNEQIEPLVFNANTKGYTPPNPAATSTPRSAVGEQQAPSHTAAPARRESSNKSTTKPATTQSTNRKKEQS